jgi:hypothetical protein
MNLFAGFDQVPPYRQAVRVEGSEYVKSLQETGRRRTILDRRRTLIVQAALDPGDSRRCVDGDGRGTMCLARG